jgi:hypothetical protein
MGLAVEPADPLDTGRSQFIPRFDFAGLSLCGDDR